MSIKKFTKALLIGMANKFLGKDITRTLDRQIIGSSDLVFSSLHAPKALKPLSGYTPLIIDNTKEISIFPEGVHASLQIFHSDSGDAVILLHHMELRIDDYWPETDLELFYQREGKHIIGAGPAVQDFEVMFAKHTVYPAERVLAPNHYVSSEDENFFNIKPSAPIEIKRGSSAQINVLALAEASGIYQLSFYFLYNVSGKQREYSSQSFLIVKK